MSACRDGRGAAEGPEPHVLPHPQRHRNAVHRTAYAKLAPDDGMSHPVQDVEAAARTRAERSWLVREWNRLPRTLAFCLLAFQVVIPWTATHFVTQDGPSHLYQAV